MKKIQKILVGSFILVGLLTANLAYAGFITEPLVPCGQDVNGDGQLDDSEKCNLCDLWHLASNIINFISFNLAIPVATILFVTAGIIFLISGGNEERVTLARSIFTNTVIGLVIIFCSWMLIDTLIKTIANPGFTEAGEVVWFWNEFPSCP